MLPTQSELDLLNEEVRPHGWHVWLSDEGTIHATSAKSLIGGSGETIDAPSLDEMRAELAERIEA